MPRSTIIRKRRHTPEPPFCAAARWRKDTRSTGQMERYVVRHRHLCDRSGRSTAVLSRSAGLTTVMSKACRIRAKVVHAQMVHADQTGDHSGLQNRRLGPFAASGVCPVVEGFGALPSRWPILGGELRRALRCYQER